MYIFRYLIKYLFLRVLIQVDNRSDERGFVKNVKTKWNRHLQK